MKVIIPGGSGQVGMFLARSLHDEGHEVVVLSRTPQDLPWRVVQWDGVTLGDWSKQINHADAVINLAGRSVNCRYNAANQKAILDSRVRSTAAVGRAIASAASPPRVWLQASTATIYAHRYDQPNDEATGIIGGGESAVPKSWRFSTDVATAWERALNAVETPRTRKVALRSAMTMSPSAGGVFDAFVTLVRRGLGGPAGNGRQFVSWIHYQDLASAIRWLIAHEDIDGVVNLAAPNPLPNAEFMRGLRAAAGVSVGIPVSRWMLELGAVFMRTETELILKSRRVVPDRLLKSGFQFRFPKWPEASRELYREWMAG